MSDASAGAVPRIAIVTPYWREDRATLERCIASVASQTVATEHILVADGEPQDWIDAQPVRHLRLDRCHGDYGNVARGLGALLAAGEGSDGIAFLDADNRIDADHVALCLQTAHATACDIVTALRRFELPDGTPVPAAEDPGLADTNCLFLLPRAYPVISRWIMIPPPLAVIGDRVFHAAAVSAGMQLAHTDRPTVTYVSRWARHYSIAGSPIPDDAQELDITEIANWLGGLSPAQKAQVQHLCGTEFFVR